MIEDNDSLFHLKLAPGTGLLMDHIPMSKPRYDSLMNDDPPPSLTPDELNQGWHFCWDFDGLLVGPDMAERHCCQCRNHWSPHCRKSVMASATQP